MTLDCGQRRAKSKNKMSISQRAGHNSGILADSSSHAISLSAHKKCLPTASGNEKIVCNVHCGTECTSKKI